MCKYFFLKVYMTADSNISPGSHRFGYGGVPNKGVLVAGSMQHSEAVFSASDEALAGRLNSYRF